MEEPELWVSVFNRISVPPLLHVTAELPSPVGLKVLVIIAGIRVVLSVLWKGLVSPVLTHGVKFSPECQLVGLSGIWSPGKYIMKTKWFCSVDSVS